MRTRRAGHRAPVDEIGFVDIVRGMHADRPPGHRWLLFTRRELWHRAFHEGPLPPDPGRVDYWDCRDDNRIRMLNAGNATIGWALVEDWRIVKITDERFRADIEERVLPAWRAAPPFRP